MDIHETKVLLDHLSRVEAQRKELDVRVGVLDLTSVFVLLNLSEAHEISFADPFFLFLCLSESKLFKVGNQLGALMDLDGFWGLVGCFRLFLTKVSKRVKIAIC
jgi:hypothetical protein